MSPNVISWNWVLPTGSGLRIAMFSGIPATFKFVFRVVMSRKWDTYWCEDSENKAYQEIRAQFVQTNPVTVYFFRYPRGTQDFPKSASKSLSSL